MFKPQPGNVSEFIHDRAIKRIEKLTYPFGAVAAIVEFLDCHQCAERSAGKALTFDETLEWIRRRDESEDSKKKP